MTQKVQPVYSFKEEGKCATVFRDSEPLKTPRNLPVEVPTHALAKAIVEECKGQGENLDLRQMPLTQMALTAIDIASHHREEVIDGIMRHGESELICQRAADPADLVAKQNEIWQPYHDWIRSQFHVELRTGSGIVPFRQKPEALLALRKQVETYDAFSLTGVSEAVGVAGSLVLGLALIMGHADVEAVFGAAELDQLWQEKKWGEDPAVAGRQAEIRRDLDDCARWFALLG